MNQPLPPGVARDMTEEEARVAFGEADPGAQTPLERLGDAMRGQPTPKSQNAAMGRVEGIPEWASLPPGFVIPPNKRLVWMRFRAEWTDFPEKGDRWCLMWQLGVKEERDAYTRAKGDGGGEHRALEELAKQAIRIVDGLPVDRTGTSLAGNVNVWFGEIGTRSRQLVENAYLQAHTLTKEQYMDFFANCFVSNTSTTG